MPFTEKMENFVISVSAKISSIKTLKAVSEVLSSLIAVIIVGEIFTLSVSIPIPALQMFFKTSGIAEVCLFINTCTIGLLSVYTIVGIARRYCILLELEVNQRESFSHLWPFSFHANIQN